MDQQISELTSLTTLFQNFVASIPALKSFEDKYIEVDFQALPVEYPLQEIQLLCLHEVARYYGCLVTLHAVLQMQPIASYEIVIGKTNL